MLNLRPLSQWLFTDKDELVQILHWLPHVRAVTGKLVNRLAMLSRSSGVGRLERRAGIEPASSGWKPEVEPLNYLRV